MKHRKSLFFLILFFLSVTTTSVFPQWFPVAPTINTSNNTFSGINYFKHIIADTVTINNISQANSTYWINGTDTLGWVA